MNIKLASGNRTDRTSNSATWFQTIGPTGQLMSLKDCRSLTRGKRFAGGSFGGQDTLMVQEYDTKESVSLMMVSTGTSFGTDREYLNLHLLVDADAEAIEVHGVGGYGGFQGRAKIGPLSVLSRAGKAVAINPSMLAKSFGYVVTSPPLKVSKKGRSLIF